MKKIAFFSMAFLLFTSLIQAQKADYNVVFDMTSADSVNQQAVVRQVNGIRQSNPDAKIEVVVYGQGLPLVLQNGSAQGEAITRLATDKNIAFRVCAATMKRMNVTTDQLLPGVQTVPDGIYEIISKQKEGWGYIKVAH